MDQHGKRLLPNLQFQIQPAAQWDFDEKFDFVHVRTLSFLVDHAAWFPSLLRNLKDGGWAEFHQWIVRFHSSNGYSKDRGEAVERWNALVTQGKSFIPTLGTYLVSTHIFLHVGFVLITWAHRSCEAR